MIFKKASIKDLDLLTNIAVKSEYKWSSDKKEVRRQIKGSLSRKGAQTYYLSKSNHQIGYIVITLKNKVANIDFMGVKKEYKNRGYGKEILKRIINLAKSKCDEIRLAVWARNLAAILIYTRLGFYVYSIKKRHYKNGDAKLLMKKELS
jgi:ribosomal protein S18 acetylase RimI-like enzyme